ncbi:MAG: DNA primase [Bacteroidales bacterium]|nr:DNA primase [Bacteroidales bacterium]
MIRREDIAKVLEAARIEEVIGEFVKLKKVGSNLRGLCPFHTEKTPSFYVSPAKGMFKCFGCGKGGSVVNFLIEHEKFSYQEAIRFLAQKYGIDLIESEEKEDHFISKTKEEQSFHLHSFAHQWFVDQLWKTGEGNSVGLEYLRKRGLRDATIKLFGLGYSPLQKDAFLQYALKAGYGIELLRENGLISESGKDRFAGRIIFPIYSVAGRVIAFAGRILQNNSSSPKYVNSPETIIYQKSKVLYGLHVAKNKIIQKDECFLVEGYMDFISLYQQGIENVVASSGTSLTEEQIKILSRYTQNITLVYDGDVAGQKATMRAVDMLLEAGLNVRIISLPFQEDPDSFAQKHDPQEILNYFDQEKQTFIEFKTQVLLNEANKDPIKKASAITNIIQSIALIPYPLVRNHMIMEIARKHQLDENILMHELNKNLSHRSQQNNLGVPVQSTLPPFYSMSYLEQRRFRVEANIIRNLLLYGERMLEFPSEKTQTSKILAMDYILREIKEDELVFENQAFQSIFSKIEALYQENNFSWTVLLSKLDPEETSTLSSLIQEEGQLSPNWRKKDINVESTLNNQLLLKNEIDNAILEFKLVIIQQQIYELIKQIAQSTDENEQTNLMREFQKWKSYEITIEARLRHRNISPGGNLELLL